MRTQARPLRLPHANPGYLAFAVLLLSPALAQEAAPTPSASQSEQAVEEQEDQFTLEETAPPDAKRSEELTRIRSSIEFGAGYVSDDAFRFGRYRGLETQGGFGVLDIDYLRRGPYDGDDAHYLRFLGSRLGLRSREASFEAGRQGDYRVRASYSRIPTVLVDDAQTVFEGIGGTHLTLPAGWVPGTTTATMTRLLPSLHSFDLEQDRHQFAFDVAKQVSRRWEFSAGLRNENRDGLKSIGGVIGNTGGNPRAVLLPEPVDYQTREFDAVASYRGRRAQFELRYYLSMFDNANDSLTWDNPFAAIAGWNPAAGFPTGQGRLGLAPDNRFQQISAAAGYDLSERARVSSDVAFGQMTQDEPFLPYTVNPVLAASIVQPLPRASLDGRIDTTVFNLRVSSRPAARLQLGASYRFDDRDNRTPRDEYVYIGGDSQTQDAGPTSSRRRFNTPYSYREHRLRFDAAYRLGGGSRLSASAERRDTQRTYSERKDATEDTIAIGFNRSLGDRVEASLQLSQTDRNGSTYHGNAPFLSSYSPGYTATVEGQWENAPDLRKYYLADLRRDRATLGIAIAPSERWSLDLQASYIDENYHASELGLTASRIGSYTADVALTPNPNLTFHGFYTRDDLEFDQAGHAFNSHAQAADPNRRWRVRHDDRIDSAGLGVRWQPMPSRWSFGADYVRVHSEGSIDVAVGPALTAAPLPPNTSGLDSLNLYGEWRLRDDWSLRAGYWYERYRSSDWALDDVAVNQLANVILLAESSPDYRSHVVTLSLIYRF